VKGGFEMTHSSLAVANKILNVAREMGLALTIMQLIKLVYIAHGWTLALLNKPLVSDPVEAWQHGPVYPDVYRAFRGSGWMPISQSAKHPFSGEEIVETFTDDEEAIIKQVVNSYGKFHAFELSAKTHKSGTPWYQTYDGGVGASSVIGNDLIKSHFDELRGVTA
jgi:uncharacterized phage-associated protein